MTAFPSVYALSHWNTEHMLSGITRVSGLSGRSVTGVETCVRDGALVIAVRETGRHFSGLVRMAIDHRGVGEVSFEHVYHGDPFRAGEAGLLLPLKGTCRRIDWIRDSEWDVYPEDHIGRPSGTARADAPAVSGPSAARSYVYPDTGPPLPGAPTWPCRLDRTGYGTDDFRATRHHFRRIGLSDDGERGLTARALGDAHARATLEGEAVHLHLWSPAMDGLLLEDGTPLSGHYTLLLAGEAPE